MIISLRWGSSKTKESYAAEAVALLGDLQDRTTITMFTDAKHVRMKYSLCF